MERGYIQNRQSKNDYSVFLTYFLKGRYKTCRLKSYEKHLKKFV